MSEPITKEEMLEHLRKDGFEETPYGTCPICNAVIALIESSGEKDVPKVVTREDMVSILAEAGGNIGIPTDRINRACERLSEAGVEVKEKP